MPRIFSNGADLRGQRVQNVGNASVGTDAVNLQQLQDYISGLDVKDAVRAATTGAITLSGAQTVDGVVLVAGDRVLVKNQADQTTNGIYVVAAGAWTRANDANSNAEVTAGLAVSVLEGTTKGSGITTGVPLLYTLTNSGTITLGTTNLNFTLYGSTASAYTAGNGLGLSGNSFSVTPKPSGGVVVDGTGVSVDPAMFGRRQWFPVGDGTSTSLTVTHSWGTLDVSVDALVEVATGADWEADVTGRTTNSVTLSFATAPANNAFRVKLSS